MIKISILTQCTLMTERS